jgi:multidrug resistance protein, MATE family
MLACLEWVYWEALSLLIGSLGTIPLSIHTVPTQVVTLAFMIPYGIGMALSVRLGVCLSANEVSRAKALTRACLQWGSLGFAMLAVCLYVFRAPIFDLFTTDEAVWNGCNAIWPHVCMFFFMLSLLGINMGIATGLGMQWTLGLVTIVFMWVLGLPTTYTVAILLKGGIEGAWATIWPAYLGINVVIWTSFARKDWHEIAQTIRMREGIIDEEDDDEKMPMVQCEIHDDNEDENKMMRKEKKELHSDEEAGTGYGSIQQ